MDFLHRACGGDGSRERIVRQILDETTQPHVGAIVVQRVSGIHHVSILLVLWWPRRRTTTPFRWSWAIVFISIFLSAADFAYFYALSHDDSMISIVSMIRRGSVIVSFLFGALLFREKNLRSKAVDLALVLIGMIFLYLGTK